MSTDDETLRLIAAAAAEGWASLDLSDRGLAALPPALFELPRLEQLNLWDNRLAALPEAIAALRDLTSLYLGGNQLTELPEAIGQLSR